MTNHDLPTSAPVIGTQPPQKENQAPSVTPFGVSTVVGDSFSLLVQCFLPVIALVFVPDMLAYQATFLLADAISLHGVPFSILEGYEEETFLGLSFLIGYSLYFLQTSLLVQLAYDAKLERPLQYGRYVLTLIKNLVPVLLLSLMVLLMIVPAFMALIIPGFWVNAVFAAVVPAVVIERSGFRALGRSIELTRNYRWPIVGAFLMVGFVSNILDNIAEKLSGFVAQASSFGLLESVVYVAISGIGTALFGILTALIYARLRELKDGISVDDIASIFD